MRAVDALTLDMATLRLAAVREAIEALGLVTLAAEGQLWHMLDERFAEHPRSICTRYRKNGEQLTDEEKRGIGVRSNSFMGRKAYSELIKRGLPRPLEEHEITLLRAYFILGRYRPLKAIQDANAGYKAVLRYSVTTMSCIACRALDGQRTSIEDAAIFPPPGCTCETANYSIDARINFFADQTE